MQKKLKVIQEEISDCGVCCLLSIIRYYGGNASLEELRISSNTTRDGVNAYNLIECAKEYGLDAIGKKETNINNINLPCIAHVKINESLSHFIVIYSIKDNILSIMDPSIGFTKITLNDFYNISSNVYLEFISRNINHTYIENDHLKHIMLKSISNQKSKVVNLILLNLILIFITLTLTTFYTILTKSNNYFIILLFIALVISKNLLEYIISNKTTKINNLISNNILINFLNHLFNLPLNYIHMKDSGELIKRYENLEEIKEIELSSILSYFINGLMLLLIFIALFIINKVIFITLLITSIIYIILSYIISKKIDHFINPVITSSSIYKTSLISYINSLSSIIHNNQSNYFISLLNNKLNNSLSNNYTFLKKINIKKLLENIIINLNIIIIITIYITFKYNYTSLITIFFINSILTNSLQNITNTFPGLIYLNKIIHKLNDFYSIREVTSNQKSFLNGPIVIKNIKFSYNRVDQIIDIKKLKIEQGEKVAIIGLNGCGKSTLCKLLTKEYLVNEGSITIKKVNINDIDLKSLHKNIIYSDQNESIITGTIKDNITLGRNIDDQVLEKVIKICRLNTLLKKKSFGINTYLFGSGKELSGGEKQLIYLSRTLILNPKILILDETLSEVNNVLEDEIINNILNAYPKMTLLYITHRDKSHIFKRIIHM